MNKVVYVIMEGFYSDKEVVGVYTDMDAAQKHISEWNARWQNRFDERRIIECVLNSTTVKDGNLYLVEIEDGGSQRVIKQSKQSGDAPTCYGGYKQKIFSTHVYATHAEEAAKIGMERRAIYLATQ